ncbi:hypothetical protein [Actinomadura madurae]|uniref:hypothetical protein n=1 Tax=Actinomadura madurae TaxID=1993 RepID=UPI000D9BE413|nr:hypothetical protein [Actinomadura madurae]SPT57092.1 Uncharacterised protein [Actinomadura madurae]
MERARDEADVAAEEVRRNLTQYLTTTFALADEEVRERLDRPLNHPEQGAAPAALGHS